MHTLFTVGGPWVGLRPVRFINIMISQLPSQLQTERLVLRKPLMADAQFLFDEYTHDPEVAHYMIWRPHLAVSETERFIAGRIEGWTSDIRRPYILALHEDVQKPVGMLDACIQLHTVSSGYVLTRRHWGKGLIPEAVSALAETALSDPHFFRVQATCDIENRASSRVLEKSGFVREARLERHAVHPNISLEPRACFMYARCK
jgi:ribosomal-protein-alanine N-acetyltransferase